MNYFKHESAIVDEGASIGPGSRIWHFTHVCAGARVGTEVSLGQNVYVGNEVIIGDYCKVQNNVSIYDNVYLDEGVFCGPSMVFTNVRNPRALIDRKDQFKFTRVGRGATLGANCTVVCGLNIGNFAFVGAGAVVTRDIRDFSLVIGSPGKQVGWMSEFGERLNLPLTGNAEVVCSQTGNTYRLIGNNLRKLVSLE